MGHELTTGRTGTTRRRWLAAAVLVGATALIIGAGTAAAQSDGTTVTFGDNVTFHTIYGKFLVAEQAGFRNGTQPASALNADRPAAGPWEAFRVEDPKVPNGKTGDVTYGTPVRFIDAHGRFLGRDATLGTTNWSFWATAGAPGTGPVRFGDTIYLRNSGTGFMVAQGTGLVDRNGLSAHDGARLRIGADNAPVRADVSRLVTFAGDRSLEAADGRFVSSQPAGPSGAPTGTLRFDADRWAAGPWEAFNFTHATGARTAFLDYAEAFNLRSVHGGHFSAAASKSTVTLKAFNASNDAKRGPVRDGDHLLMRDANGQWAAAVNGAIVWGGRDDATPFLLRPAGAPSTRAVTIGSTVTLESAFGKFVVSLPPTTDDSGTPTRPGEVKADRSATGAWERFVVQTADGRAPGTLVQYGQLVLLADEHGSSLGAAKLTEPAYVRLVDPQNPTSRRPIFRDQAVGIQFERTDQLLAAEADGSANTNTPCFTGGTSFRIGGANQAARGSTTSLFQAACPANLRPGDAAAFEANEILRFLRAIPGTNEAGSEGVPKGSFMVDRKQAWGHETFTLVRPSDASIPTTTPFRYNERVQFRSYHNTFLATEATSRGATWVIVNASDRASTDEIRWGASVHILHEWEGTYAVAGLAGGIALDAATTTEPQAWRLARPGSATSGAGGPQSATDRTIPTTAAACNDCIPTSAAFSDSWHPLVRDVTRFTAGHEIGLVTADGTIRVFEDAHDATRQNERLTELAPRAATKTDARGVVVATDVKDADGDGDDDVLTVITHPDSAHVATLRDARTGATREVWKIGWQATGFGPFVTAGDGFGILDARLVQAGPSGRVDIVLLVQRLAVQRPTAEYHLLYLKEQSDGRFGLFTHQRLDHSQAGERPWLAVGAIDGRTAGENVIAATLLAEADPNLRRARIHVYALDGDDRVTVAKRWTEFDLGHVTVQTRMVGTGRDPIEGPRAVTLSSYRTTPRLAVADFDGNGFLDLVVMGKPHGWLGPEHKAQSGYEWANGAAVGADVIQVFNGAQPFRGLAPFARIAVRDNPGCAYLTELPSLLGGRFDARGPRGNVACLQFAENTVSKHGLSTRYLSASVHVFGLHEAKLEVVLKHDVTPTEASLDTTGLLRQRLATAYDAFPLHDWTAADVTQSGYDEILMLRERGTISFALGIGLSNLVHVTKTSNIDVLTVKSDAARTKLDSRPLTINLGHPGATTHGRLAGLDIDGDGEVWSYDGPDKGHVLAITNPRVRMLLTAPPWVDGIGQDPSSVSFSTTTTHCNSVFEGFARSDAGLFGQTEEISVGLGTSKKVFEVTAQVGGGDEFSASEFWSRCTESGRTWQASGTVDSLLFDQSPVDVYIYTIAAHRDKTKVGGKQTLFVPGKPATELWPVAEYNRAAERYNAGAFGLDATKKAAIIDSNLLPHAIGDPRTYPAPAARDALMATKAAQFGGTGDFAGSVTELGEKTAEFRKALETGTASRFVYRSAEIDVTNAPGSAGVSVSFSNESGKSIERAVMVTSQIELSAFGFAVAYEASRSWLRGHEVLTGNGDEFSAEVNAITNFTLFKEHRFKWGLFVYPDDVGESFRSRGKDVPLPVPVVRFWVDEYRGSGPVGRIASAPALLAPAAGATPPATFEFKWKPLPNAVTYEHLVTTTDGTSLATYEHRFTLPREGGLPATPVVKSSQVPGLKPNVVYEWSVRGIDRVGDSGPWSAPQRFAVTTPPPRPTGLRVEDVQYGPTVILEWQPYLGTGSDGLGRATRYDVTVATATGGPPQTFTATDGRVAVPLASGTYTARVTAVNGAGASAPSVAVDIVVPDVPPSPTVTATPRGPGATPTLPLRWTEVPFAVAYRVQVRDGATSYLDALTGSGHWQALGALNGTDYWAQVTPIGQHGPGAPSAWTRFEATTPPSGAVLLNATVTDGAAQPPLTWPPVQHAKWYDAEIAVSSGFSVAVSTYNLTLAAFDPIDLVPGEYYARVRAASSGGAGPWTNATLIRATREPVPAPAANATAAGAASVLPLKWSGVPRAIEYQIETVDAGGVTKTRVARGTSWTSQIAAGEYTARVRAVTANGFGPWSDPVGFEVFVPPSFAPQPTATNTSRPVQIGDLDANVTAWWHAPPVTWQAVPTATSYTVQVSRVTTFETIIATRPVAGTSWSDTTLAAGEYFVRVRALNHDAGGPWSAPVAIFVESEQSGVKVIPVAAFGVVATLAAAAFARRRPGAP